MPFLLTFVPALTYAFIVFMSFPRKSINLRIAFLYFLMGSIAVTAVTAFQWILPGWTFKIEDFLTGLIITAFIQVALLEEGMKLLFYRFTSMYRGRRPMPHAIMFYSMSIAAGFAVVENMMYAWRFGPDVLWIRSYSAIILHMLAGLIMGYFISLGVYKRKLKYLFQTLGLVSATFIHGLYDFNVMVSYQEYMLGNGETVFMSTGLGVNMLWVLMPGVIVAIIMYLHLNKLREKKNASPPFVKLPDL